MKVYLDNAATTPLSNDMIDYLSNTLKIYGNPNSAHSIGDKAKFLIEEARSNIAKFINACPNDIIFTPSGSASNTLAINGFINSYNKLSYSSIIYSPLCHKSIINCIHDNYSSACELKVNKYGVIDILYLTELLKFYKSHNIIPYVVIDYANSEIGTIQDVKSIINLVHKYNGYIYLDCTGSIPYIKIDVNELDADMIGFSAHKLGALKGIGVLFKKDSITLSPIIYGAQENGIVGGTYNTLGIASLGYAVEHYDYEVHTDNTNRNYLYSKIIDNIDDIYLVGSWKNRLPCHLNICFKNVDSTFLVTLLDRYEIQVSTGSACNSGNPEPSYILEKIGINKDDLYSCVRFTLSGKETAEQLDYVIDKLKICVNSLRNKY